MNTMITTIATYIGYAVMILSAIGIVAYVITMTMEWDHCDDYTIAKIFGFGVIVVRSNILITNLNTLRKTENKTVFFEAPPWFNKNVYNFGVKK